MTHVISAVRPGWTVPGGRVSIEGVHLPVPPHGPPHVLVGSRDARVNAASHSALVITVPDDAESGRVPVRIDELPGETVFLEVARSYATGLHQVDSPAFGADDRLYCTVSGSRGTQAPVPLYRIGADGAREPVPVELANPTSLALGPDGLMYVSSRFDGQVHRLLNDDRVELYATELGVTTGLAFGPDGWLYVGDRSGTIFRVSPDRRVETFASLPASVAAFHLAFGPDGSLYVSAPTLSTHDSVFRITPDRLVQELITGLGRPQGLAFEASGLLYVIDALAGETGLFRVDVSQPSPSAELVLRAPTLVGIAFAPEGGLVLASSEAIWWLDCALKPLRVLTDRSPTSSTS